MSKTLGTILTIVAIGVAIASGVGALAAGTAALISAGVAAAQFVNSAVLASRAKDALQKRQASVAALQLGEVAREGIFGEVMTGGSLVDAFNWGGQYGTDWECRIIAVADHFCDALVGYYVNDAFVQYTGDGAVPGYNGQLEVYWRSGAVIQSVPDVVLANAPGWTANDFGSGVAWVAVCYKADKADAKNPIWPGGRPGFAWVVRGKRCYQARKDSTVGGSGAHRWSDPSAWEWTDNPIDCRHNWVRGIYAGDRIGDPDMLLVGRGLSAEEAPPANVFAPANICDELVALDAGGSEKRYRLNGLVRADETYIEVEDHFAAACAGVILQPEGAVEIEPGQAKAPSFFFSDEDLLVGSSVEYSDELSEADDGWVNTVAPRYVEPSLKYADHAAPIRRVVADVLADGGPREQPLSLTMVTSSTQAGRVGEIARRLGRLLRRGKVTLGPAFAEVEEGDWGVWTSQRYLKGKSVMFRVEAYSLDEKWHNTLTLREIVRDVYARDADAASTAVALQQDAPSIGAPGASAWTAAAIVTGANGRSMPAIAVTGTVDSDYADLVRFEYCVADAGGPAANARWIEAGFAGPDAQRFEITGVAASTGYAVAVSYVVGRVPGERRVLPTITTMAASVGWTDISDPDGTRPEPNATNSADPDSPFGTGRVRDAVAKLARIEPLSEAIDLLAKGRIDTDAAQRQAGRDIAQMQQAALRAILEADSTRVALRDAGLTVDPATGRVFLYAVDALGARTSRVEIDLDATKTLISLTASRDYVNEKIALAQLDATGKAAFEEVMLRLARAEVRLDGDEATIALKADATVVTLLKGTVRTVREDLDALAGVVSTLATSTEVDRLGVRVASAETRLGQIGDTTGFSLDIRQARFQADTAARNALESILAGDEINRTQLIAAAQIRQELYTRIVDGDAAEAVQRSLLTTRMGAAEAALAQETFARVEQGKALAQATSALEAKLGQDIAATVQSLTKAITDGDQASATSITQLGARLDSFGGVTIEQSFKALVDRTGKLEGRYTLAIDSNGRVQGFVLAGSSSGPASLGLIDTDLRMGTGRVIFNNGSAMQVQGVGFGVASDLIEWFGPTMDIAKCSRANGTAWKATDGSAYFGGGLSAGVLYASTSNPSLDADAVAVLGPYGTNGKKKIVVASYTFERTARMTSNWSSTGTPSATLAFERLVGNGSWAAVQTITTVGHVDRTSGYANENEPDVFRESMSGSVTITDTTDPSADRMYRLRLTSRSQATLNGTHTTRDQTTQRLFISSTEE